MPTITFLRTGNCVTAEPTTPAVRDLLAPALTFLEQRALRGRERYQALKYDRPVVVREPWELFVNDHRNRITFPYGFAERAKTVLAARGFTVVDRNLTPPDPSIFVPDWERVLQIGELRYRQDEFLVKVASYDNGCFDCPTGWGKTLCLAFVAAMWPRARIAIVAPRVSLLCERIYPELCQMLPSVGIHGGGKHTSGRVMCYTANCLHRLVREAKPFDAVFYDECHTAGADATARMLGQIPGQPRMYGLSGSQNMRFDGKDFRVEGLFGPIRMSVTYEEARQQNMVVPLCVVMRKVLADIDPCDGVDDLVWRKRLAIWANDYRNAMVLEDALRYPSYQVMIYAETVEHLLYLYQAAKQRGVELPLLYAEAEWKEKQVRRWRDAGLPVDTVPRMTTERRRELTQAAASGQLRLFAANSILNVGFNAPQLAVCVRADGGTSRINDRQVPGRTCRLHDGKEFGIIHDYDDRFNSGFARRSASRRRSYGELGWKVIDFEPRPRLRVFTGECA